MEDADPVSDHDVGEFIDNMEGEGLKMPKISPNPIFLKKIAM